jgi:hypothetical protein
LCVMFTFHLINMHTTVLFIATHSEIGIENGYQYLFPKMKKKMKY